MEQNNPMATNQSASGPQLSGGLSFINPEKVIDQMEFLPGMKIADFGCGTGYFCFPLARKIGREGIVYALDILKEKLETIESQAKILGLTNIVCKRANLELENGSQLEPDSMDWVLLVNMLFQNSDEGKSKIVAEAKRVLKKGGRILIIEWSGANLAIGPDKSLRVSEDVIKAIANKNDLEVSSEVAVSDYHFGLIVVKI